MGSASVGAVLVAAVLAGCSQGGGAEREGGRGRGGRAPQALPVAATVVGPRDLARAVTVTGPVEPIRAVAVNAQMAGTVLAVHVEEGRRVQAGALMAELDARETSAQLDRARALLANAEAIFSRAERLQAGELASAAELDAARSAYQIAQADVELWSTRLAFSRITAPVPGVVTEKRIERGSAVSTNETLFEIADDSQLVVRVRVSELDVVHLEPGRSVTVQLDAYPNARIAGRIRRVFPSADAASRLVPVEVVLGPAPAGVGVRPGFLARVEFAFDQRDGVLAVPASAIGVTNGNTFVYLVEADTLARRDVQTGITAAGWVEVTRGLAAGDRVVSSGHTNLRPGAPVRISGGEGSQGDVR